VSNGDKPIQLREGTICKIISLGKKTAPVVTQGTFKGYTIVGDCEGICIELDASHKNLKGKLRVIPTMMILSIDILSESSTLHDEEEETTARYMG
jgi:hypothetical protein